MAASDTEVTTKKALFGAYKLGALGGGTGFLSGGAIGALAGIINPLGLGFAAIAIGAAAVFSAPLLPIAIAVGIGVPMAIGGIMGASAGLAIGAGAGASIGAVSGALSGAEVAAARSADLEVKKERFKGGVKNEIVTAQANALDEYGTQLYLQGVQEGQAMLVNQMMSAQANQTDKKFVGTCCGTEPRTHQKVVADSLAAVQGPAHIS